ncbi:hypothetical protein ACJMK2_020227 [Sinanodonta woodiana]|uniref:TIR domain-containing protein n=1 Tax=Sinanodonta woodiana TaxID=1069815 RepID=A0ABD3U145_SINWO
MEVNVIIDELPRDIAVVHQTKEKMPLPPGKKYHIFFSYRDVERDKCWVKRLIDKLETEYGYTCCDHERDFLPGTHIMVNIKYGVKNSEKVVVVFSKEAMESHYVSLEAAIAYKLGLETRKNILIPVLLDDCVVPEEYLLMTYIDAREGVEEATWLPKLLKALESTVDKTFAVKHLCSVETSYSYLQGSLQKSSKYLPTELRPEATGIPDEIIQRIYDDVLESPRVLCRQKYWFFTKIWIVLGVLGSLALFITFVYPIIDCIESPPCPIRAELYVGVGFFIVFPVSCFFGYKKCFTKNPNSVHKNVIEHNKTLSKYGVMVTLVHAQFWKSASLIFYTCTFELCKEYVIQHLAKKEITSTIEHTHIPDSGQMVAPLDDLPILSGAVDHNPSRELSVRNVDVINQAMSEEIEDADDEPLISIKETRNMDYETKAINMLMSCTPEYFTLIHAKKLKNPEKDRHGRDVMCLCQYLEMVDKAFGKKVKTMQSLNRKISIEENDENNKNLKHISLN